MKSHIRHCVAVSAYLFFNLSFVHAHTYMHKHAPIHTHFIPILNSAVTICKDTDEGWELQGPG